jgi:hypothetical protein
LGQIGPDARSAIPALKELLGEEADVPPPPPVAVAAAEEGDNAGVATAVVPIAPAKCDDTQLLSDLAAPPRVPDADAKVRQAAIQALERIQGRG